MAGFEFVFDPSDQIRKDFKISAGTFADRNWPETLKKAFGEEIFTKRFSFDLKNMNVQMEPKFGNIFAVYGPVYPELRKEPTLLGIIELCVS